MALGQVMVLRIPDTRHDVDIDIDEGPTVEGAHPSQHLDAHPSGVASPAPLTPSQSRLGTVIAVAGLGLLMIARDISRRWCRSFWPD
jgi:hypothetical protein